MFACKEKLLKLAQMLQYELLIKCMKEKKQEIEEKENYRENWTTLIEIFRYFTLFKSWPKSAIRFINKMY